MYDLVERVLASRLENEVAWPVKPFKFEMEKYEIYQNLTGEAIDDSDIIERDTLNVNNSDVEKVPFYFKPETEYDDIKSSEIFSHSIRIYKLTNDIGEFANLVGYVTLCKIYNELKGNIEPLGVYPENDSPMILSHTDRVPDGLLQFPTEYAPVEVYNGMDYLNSRSDKWDQLTDLSSDDTDMSDCSPILINRRSESGDFKDDLRKENVTVIDTDCAIIPETLYDEYEDSIEYLNLEGVYEKVPGLEGANGSELYGEDYDVSSAADAANPHDSSDPEEQRQNRLTPPEDMLKDIDEIPKQYRERVRGGVQLHYVNTLYRAAEEPTRRASCLTIQQMYNNLLRSPSGIRREDAIEEGYEDACEKYGRIMQRQPDEAVLSKARKIVRDLIEENVIFERDGNISARRSTHPQQWFEFET